MNKENKCHITQNEEVDRQLILEEIRKLRGMSFMEIFENNDFPPGHFEKCQLLAEQLEAVLMLSEKTGIPVTIMRQRSWIEHNVINHFVSRNDIESARKVALNPEHAKVVHKELFNKITSWILQESQFLP